jgi:hypothetical protein
VGPVLEETHGFGSIHGYPTSLALGAELLRDGAHVGAGDPSCGRGGAPARLLRRPPARDLG